MNNTFSAIVTASLQEDIGDGDISAALISPTTQAIAQIKCLEPAVICGVDWVTEVYRQLNKEVILDWKVADGARVIPGQIVVELQGSARILLTGERCALNGLQTLSGTATTVAQYVARLEGTTTRLLDTRKTIPGLRAAQKYAVVCGGGKNHRMGLFDAYLIKENHIISCGSITNAIRLAKAAHPDKPIEVEVETLEELQQALSARADIIMLDNFDLPCMHQAVLLNKGQAKLEVSGNISLDTIREIALMGVDYISVGALTKHVRAIDFSMRVTSLSQSSVTNKEEQIVECIA